MMSDSFTVTQAMLDDVRSWRERPLDEQSRKPLIPHLRSKFALTYEQAQAVVLEANLRVMRAI
jgi:hypothetical protein